tara:strand:+ start:4165 stop:5532 length:1368 start_codon:yes stop_codon:yes gene_type:complete
MKPLKIFINPGAKSALEITEAKYAIRTLGNIAGFPTQFFSNSKEGPFDLAYSSDPSKVDCRVFIPMAANKTIYDLTPTKLVEGKVQNDIVLTTYILISGLHELGMKRDSHGHHHIETSVLYNKNLLHIPLINQYAKLLREIFASYSPLPIWPKGKTWAAAITHDVDYPQMIRWIEILRYLIVQKSKSKLSVIKDIIKGTNHFWKFQDWVDLETKNGVRSAFYFCGKKGNLLKYLFGIPDPFYDVCSEEFKNVINYLKGKGFEVGLHASYNSFKSLNAFKTEIKSVESSLGESLKGNRHHYWHLNQDDPSQTSEIHEKAGLLYDSSICYEKRAGFRYGIAAPFRLFHKNKKQISNCLQLPTAFMDDHMYRHLKYSQFKSPQVEINTLINQVKIFSGLFIVDYHVRRLNDTFFPGWGKLFQFILEIISNDSECYCDTPAAIAKYWIARENKIRDSSL